MGYPRIEYNSIKVDFDKPFNDFNFMIRDRVVENEAASGVIERLHFYGREFIHALCERMKGGIVQQLREWYRYVRDGSTFKLWWDRDLGFYCDFEGKRLYTKDGDAWTFARTLLSTYTDRSTGEVETLSANQPRWEVGQFGDGIGIESAVTNYIEYSQKMDEASGGNGWSVGGGGGSSVTVTANTTDITAPDGTSTANKLVSTGVSGYIKATPNVAIGTNDSCFSIWLRAQDDDGATISISESGGTELATSSITLTTAWVRYDVAYDSAADWGAATYVCTIVPGTSQTIYAWGAQLESGTNKLYPKSYIVNSGAGSASNSDETCYLSVTDGLQAWSYKGTISLWVKHGWAYNDSANHYFLAGLDAGGNAILWLRKRDTNTLTFSMWSTPSNPNGTLNAVSGTITSMAADTWHHVVATWDCSTANSFKIYLDSVLLATGTTVQITPEPLSKIYLGTASSSPTGCGDCWFDDLAWYKDVKNQDWVTNTYNIGKALGHTKNYWSALLLADPEFEPVQYRGGDLFDFTLKAKENLT